MRSVRFFILLVCINFIGLEWVGISRIFSYAQSCSAANHLRRVFSEKVICNTLFYKVRQAGLVFISCRQSCCEGYTITGIGNPFTFSMFFNASASLSQDLQC